MTAAEFEGLLNAHAFLRVERPPLLWVPDSELEPFTRLLGELISAGLVRNGGVLDELTLNIANVIVEPEAAGRIPIGELVAVTIRGTGEWAPETTWAVGDQPAAVLESAQQAATVAGASYLYSRVLAADEGSVTVLLPRHETTSL
jgi:hypothetical protein